MIDWNNQKFGIKLPDYQVFDKKTGKTLRACDSLEMAKKLIAIMDRKKK